MKWLIFGFICIGAAVYFAHNEMTIGAGFGFLFFGLISFIFAKQVN